ncbi:transcriptional regulator, DeoR family [Acetitomaculum ruminis DSM 5522]|uniref:Transcriptional regulator, DeoR family n=1 Tax=Acetitomaculum ruminis DSM 5522 TaxID=1120918 RepID=A0A1I1AD99_9FIRM|nr:DeoR/GlpR family DNA-binding transcription regulator [Acetitomaculum ruminis]SFB35964.1 transcriptional regulator, DeoR family [Acetitomaculum ruminis DSM 5522]
MLAEERKNLIEEKINQTGVVKVSELSKYLKATEATIRRDLEELQLENKLKRTHGGAISINPVNENHMPAQDQIKCLKEKQAIAQKAYEYINDFDTILFDGSSTVLELCKLVAKGDKKGIIVVTNSLGVANVLSNKKDITVITIGGEMRYAINSTVGQFAERVVKDLRVEKTFMGVNGIDASYGYSITFFEEASLKKLMLKNAKETFVLADHTKFGETYLAKVADFNGGVHNLVTDKLVKDFDYEFIKENVNLIVAG